MVKNKTRIFLHILFWLSVFTFMYLTSRWPGIKFKEHILNCIVSTLILTIPYYLNIFYFIPKFFKPSKSKIYFVVVGLFIILFVPSGVILIRAIYFLIYSDTFMPSKIVFNQNINMLTWNTILSLAISGISSISFRYFKSNEKILQTENENLKLEVKLLRSQLNPHFLFNTLNVIYFQIDEDLNKSKKTIESLSSLLRFILNSSNKNIILLSEEIQFINDFCALKMSQMEKSWIVNLDIDSFENKKYQVAPLLIFTLIENAFKHFSNTQTHNDFIKIIIKDTNKNIRIEVSNSFLPNKIKQEGGLGLINLKRQLDLIYKKNASLEINTNYKNFMYSVILILPYEIEMYNN